MNKEYIEREFAAYRNLESEARAILDAAASETRTTTAEEDERFDKLTAEAKVRKARADALAAMDADSAALSSTVRSLIGDQTTSDDGEPNRNATLMSEVRSTLAGIKDGSRRAGETVIDLPVDAAEYQRVITDFGSGTSLYTSDFATTVVVYQRTFSPWIANAQVISANNGRPLIIPTSTVDPTSYTPGEGTAITASDPTLGTVTATPVSYKHLGYISAEAEEDEVVGLMGVIARQAARSLGLAFGSAATTAILAAAANGGTATAIGGTGTAAGTFIGADDLFTLKYGRAAPYRMGGAFVASNGLIQKAKKWKDANGQYLLQPAIGAGSPDSFDGNPIYEDPALATPASASKSVLFGDLSLFVVKAMPLRVAVSTEFAFNLDNVAIKTVYRAGGALTDSAGLAYIVSANS